MNCRIKRYNVLISVLSFLLIVTACVNSIKSVDLAKIKPRKEYFIKVNDNIPQFAEDEITTESFESYSELDELGRCGTAVACIGRDLMPTEERGAIGQIKPSGWQLAKYDIVDGKYLYNRCHLIGYQLTGENANEKNLFTGTRSMNVNGMLPFENTVADYIEETDNHVMYRVTPVYDGKNLLAKGVQMEAYSVEDKGSGISFNVFVFNSQPGIKINYKNGESRLSTEAVSDDDDSESSPDNAENKEEYILNLRTKKIHRTDCTSVKSIQEQNKEVFNGTKEYLIDNGYSECDKCKP